MCIRSIAAFMGIVLLSAGPCAFAANATKTAKKAKAAAPAASAPSEAVQSMTPQSGSGASQFSFSDVQYTVGGPVTFLDGTAMWGAYVNGMWKMMPNFSVGAETGFHIGSAGAAGISATIWEIPLLATGFFHFQIPDAPALSPFVGLGVGLGFYHGSVGSVTISGITVGGGSSTDVNFETQAHLGASFGPEKRWVADLRLGLANSSFLFSPTVGYRF